MSGKSVFRRLQARLDVEDAVDFYRREAGEPVALRFIEAVRTALRAIAEHPAAGSPRYAQELDLPGLRHRLLKGLPHLVFYVEHAQRVDVWRVLHAHRDIPAWLQGPEDQD